MGWLFGGFGCRVVGGVVWAFVVSREDHRLPLVGTWRSLVAHLLGVQGVASSNLAVPTT